MKTEVPMERPFMGSFVRQKSKSEMFSASDLIKIGNIKRAELGISPFNLSQFLSQKSTVEFIEELQKTNDRVIIRGRGRKSVTWVHPLLFIDIALALNPKFKVEVYQWLYDELIKYRNDSGDSYRKMAGSLYDRYENKQKFYKYIERVANYIKKSCGVEDWNKANQHQLKLRDKIHDNISLLCSVMKNTDECVRVGVQKALEDNKAKLTENN